MAPPSPLASPPAAPPPSLAVAAFSPPAFDHDRAVVRLLNAVLRGAAAGFCLRGGLHLASLLFSLLLKSRKQRQVRPVSLAEQLRDTLRYTAFLGSFGGVYVSLDEGIAAWLGKRRTAKWRAFFAGALAGPTLLLTGSETRHTSLALYILLRGITLLVRIGNQPDSPPALRKALAPTRWRHGDTALMCLATSQIGFSWIMLPQTLPRSYVSFLNKHGGKQLHHYAAVRELAKRNEAGLAPGRLAALAGTRHAAFAQRIPCDFLHPGRSCSGHLAAFLPQAYARAVPVYLPVYLLPAILVHRRALLRKDSGPRIWAKIGAGAARSSAFLALYCALAWRGACAGWGLTGTSTGLVIAASCWTGGLATLAEKKSRRMELALYCTSRAAESFALCLAHWGLLPRRFAPRRLDVLMFSAATAAIMHCYSDSAGRHRDVFRSKYLNVLDFVFGGSGHEQGAIHHVPSATQLFERLEAQLPVDTRAWRAHATSLLNLERLAAAAAPDSPTSVASAASDPGGAITDFRSTQRESFERAAAGGLQEGGGSRLRVEGRPAPGG